jgi:hemolysin III
LESLARSEIGQGGYTRRRGRPVKDPLEEGLEELSWIDSGRAAVSRFKKKTQTFGEEIGNAVSHGVMALLMLCLLPFAAVRAYTHAPAGKEILDATGVSIFCIGVFLMFLGSTVYHSMAHGTKHKGVLNRIDHIMIFVAIAGTYTPICLSIIGGVLGIVLCSLQWALVVAGALFKALAFSKTAKSYIITISIYILMGWMVVLCFPILIHGATAPAFWLIVAGGICYTSELSALRCVFRSRIWSGIFWWMPARFVIFLLSYCFCAEPFSPRKKSGSHFRKRLSNRPRNV